MGQSLSPEGLPDYRIPPTILYLQTCEYASQGFSQDLNQPLQNIVENFDDDVIITTLTSLL